MRVASIILLPLVAGGCLLPGAAISPYGRNVTAQASSDLMQGELIAVAHDTMWVLQEGRLRGGSLAAQRRIHVQRHNFGFGRTMRWLLTAGVGTGGALFISCSSYESSSDGGGDSMGCLALIPGTTLFFAAAGLLFGGINELTSVHRFAPADSARLRAFARYPQGLPDTLRSQTFLPRAPRLP